jgi:hypothetical protein
VPLTSSATSISQILLGCAACSGCRAECSAEPTQRQSSPRLGASWKNFLEEKCRARFNACRFSQTSRDVSSTRVLLHILRRRARISGSPQPRGPLTNAGHLFLVVAAPDGLIEMAALVGRTCAGPLDGLESRLAPASGTVARCPGPMPPLSVTIAVCRKP